MTHEEILSMLGDYVDYLIANSSAEAPMWNIEKVRSGKPNKWNYIDGCMITACLSLYKTTGDEKYLKFSKDFIDWFVQEDGSIKTYDPKEYNLDNVNQGKNLFILYDIFGDEKYRKAIDTIRSQLLTQPRTREGNFWHKDIYPWQVWLDGTYMAQPFYMEYETRYNKMQGCIDSYKQFMNIKKHMRDEKTGLYYHGYDESRQMYWADPVTGCSPNFWLRAMGWFMVAMVDVLERMDEQLYNEYRGIMAFNPQLSVGVGGMWQPYYPNSTGATYVDGSAFVKLSVPIFHWGERRRAVGAARAVQLQQEWNAALVHDDIVREEMNGWTALVQSRAQVDASEESLRIAGENLSISTYSYGEGLATILDRRNSNYEQPDHWYCGRLGQRQDHPCPAAERAVRRGRGAPDLPRQLL